MRLRALQVVAAVCVLAPGRAAAQALESSEDRPRFLVMAVAGKPPTVVDASSAPVLRRRVTAAMDGVALAEALQEVGRQAGVRFAVSREAVPVDKRVSLHATDLTLGAALFELLSGLGLDVQFSRNQSSAAIVRRAQTAAQLAQVGIVTGRVTDVGTQQPVPLAEVRVVGSEIAAATDDSGRYVLRDVPVGEQRVTVRRIGYEAQTQTVTVPEGGTVTLDFALKVAPTRLDELVTTVTGDQRRLEVGNTIATINADSLMQTAPVMSFGDLLQGRAPGVLSLPEGGMTGKAGRIRIRGLNSFQVSNDPIVVVDGARVEASAGADVFTGSLTGRLADLNPDEIASVEIVKGPAAATLYGTDAANGVLVITTKRGQPGRTRVTAFTEQGLLEQRLDDADIFSDGYYAFGRSTATDEPQRCTLLQRAEGICVVDSLASFNTFTDPATRPFKDGRRQQYGLQLSGGTAGGTTYFLSGEYEQETGTAHMPAIDQALIRTTQGRTVPDWQERPNAFDRVNLRANLTAPLGQRGSATLATGFVSNQARVMEGNFPFTQVGFRDANDGWFGGGTASNRRPAFAFAQRSEDVVRRFTGSLATTYSVHDWLTLRGTVGADLSTTASGQLLRQGEQPFSTGQRATSDLSIVLYSLDLGATATRALSAAVSSKTSVGVQYNRRAQRRFFSGFVENLPLGGETIAGGTLLCCNEEAALTTAVAGGYVEEVLGLHDRLFLTGALRFDGGSAFGQDFSVAAYPKASVSWVVTDGQAGPSLPAVSALRLRAGYGTSGVQPGPTDALALIAVQNGFDVTGTATGPAGTLVGGNPDLKPERTSELEAGLDLELWASRVRLEFTAYQRTSTDALVSRPNGPDVGGERIENLGSVRNRGLELLLSADLVRGRGVAAGFTATGLLNQNRLRRLGEGVLLSSPVQELTRQDLGYPVFGLWGYTLESFPDANENGIIEPGEIVLSGPNTQFIGSSFPTREATVAPYVKLFGERLHLSGLFQYRGGFHRSTILPLIPCFDPAASCRAVNDIGTPLAEQAQVVAFTSLGRFGPSTKDASYVLLRELSLGLAVPRSVVRVLGARAGQVVLAGRNLALLWKASDVPLENSFVSSDDGPLASQGPGPSSYWLLRVHLNY